MRTLLAAATVSLAVWGAAGVRAQSTTVPVAPPSTTTAPAERGVSAAPAIDRLETALAEIGLSDEQKAAVDQLSKVMNGNPRERILRAAGAR